MGNQDRGYQLELMLTKVQYSTAAVDENCSSGNGIQIVGMSATLSNASDLAQWLSARLYQTDFRPIELQRRVKVGINASFCPAACLSSLNDAVVVAWKW